MQLYRMLIFAFSLTSSNVVSLLTYIDQTTLSTDSTTALNLGHFNVTDLSERRFLKVDNSAGTSRFSFKENDNKDDTDDDSEVKKSFSSEERAGDGTLKLVEGVSKTAKSFSEKLASALPLKLRLQQWSKNEKPLDFITVKLGLSRLMKKDFIEAKNYKLYDDYVTSQLPIWTKKKLSTDEVMVRLGLNTLSGSRLTDAVNYKYYEEFVVIQMKIWMKNDLPLENVMTKLNLDKLSGTDILSHPNYKYYKNFVTNKLKTWATAEGFSHNDIMMTLGLNKLRGRALENHPNYRFLLKFEKNQSKYREEGWLKQSLSTYNVWKKLEVHRIRPVKLRGSYDYKVYKSYVNLLDDYIINLLELKLPVPNLISKDATKVELRTKTFIWIEARRPEWYVKYSLRLNGLEDTALKKAANYQFLEQYRGGIVHMR